MADHEYDVALSFAGEDRTFVERVATLLREHGIRVFYDEFEVVRLWGEDLYTFLDEVYRIRSRYAVVFASEHYTRKMWTSHERQAAQAASLEKKEAHLLPVRLDATEVPGLRPTVGYLDGQVYGPDGIARMIIAKVGATVAPKPGRRSAGPPVTADLTRDAVLAAIAEFDRLGRDEFLRVTGFGRSRSYYLEYQGRHYDSKAIVGYAHQVNTGKALTSADFHGGANTVSQWLRALGFEVRYLPKAGSGAADPAD